MKTRIIVATLGERNTLKQTLKSIAIQNIDDLEVKIVIPIGKTDYLNQITTEVNLMNYQLIEDEGRGLSAAINQGFSAQGDFEFFGWINDDDELSINSLSRSINFLDCNKECLAVIGRLEYIREKSEKRLVNKVSVFNLYISKFGPNMIPQPGSLIKRLAVAEEKLLDETYKYAMDLDLWLKIMKFGKVGILKEIQALMNWHGDSITVSNRKRATNEAFRIKLKHSEKIVYKVITICLYVPTRLILGFLSKVI